MSQTIETTIAEALERTGVNKEYTLCRYLPSDEVVLVYENFLF